MQPENLTLQIFHHQQWHDAAELSFNENFVCTHLDYLNDYAFCQDENGDFLCWEKDDIYALGLNYPVNIMGYQNQPFTFLDDIIPAGASRRYWIRHLGIGRQPENQQNHTLLQRGTIAPIGNMRIKQAVPHEAATRHFQAAEAINRQADFLEYAQEHGAIAGGATGAGGEAPKLLLRQTPSGEVWIDNQQDGKSADAYYLVKYPRNQRTPIDCDILRAEFYFYHELAALGFATINTRQMKLEEGERYPSLWLPRFDVEHAQEQTVRLAMESVYSLLERGAGSYLNHGETLRAIVRKIQHSHLVQAQGFQLDAGAWISQWLQRDLLNIAFGNSDNHGRNTAFIRRAGSIEFAPVYDFAPMKADPEGIIRSTTWGAPLENGGEYDFSAIAQSFADLADPDALLAELQSTAEKLLDLKHRLHQRGVPSRILEMAGLGYDYLPEKLKRWGLL